MPTPPQDPVARLIDALRAIGLDHRAHESVADFLYLAEHWNLFPGSGESPSPSPNASGRQSSADPGPKPPVEPPAHPATPEAPSPKPASSNEIFAESTAGAQGGEGRPASRIGVPDPAALPNPLLVARALRPLARRRLSRRDLEFDETATADESAHRRDISLVFHPVRERWFDVLLLVEDTVSMAVWQRAIAEFTTLLGTHGAFRDVRRARFRVAAGAVEIVEQTGRVRGARSIIDPEGRRLVLLLTHGVTPAWAGGPLHAALLNWAARQPVAILQMLPEPRWEHTELGEADTLVRAARPGTPNTQWTAHRPSWQQMLHPTGTAIPILTLRHQDVGQWARMLMAQASAAMPAIFISPTFDAEERPGAAPVALKSAEALVSRFRANASPEAWRLAVALAGSPLLLPVMRLVQQTIFPPGQVEQVHLAEVLLGGLMERINKTPDPESDAFEFHPGVRDLLAESLPVQERYAVRTRVFDYIRQHQDTLRVFPALVPHKDGQERLPAWAAPFAVEDDAWLRSSGVMQQGDPHLRRFSSAVTAVAYSPSGKLAIGFEDGVLDFDGERTRGEGAVVQIAFSPFGSEEIAALWSGGTYRGPGDASFTPERIVWLRRGTVAFALLKGQVEWPGGVQLSLDSIGAIAPLFSGSFAMGRVDGEVRLIHPTNEVPIFTLAGPCTALACMGGNKVAAGSLRGQVVIWEEHPQGSETKPFTFSGAIQALAWSADGRLAVGHGRRITVFDSTLQAQETFVFHTEPVTSLAWSPDGKLVSGSRDRTLRFWSFQSRPAIAFIGEHHDLERALIARGHPVHRELTAACRAWVVLAGQTPHDDSSCVPLVRYQPRDSFEDVFARLDAALELPLAGQLHGFPADLDPGASWPEEEIRLRRHIGNNSRIIAVTGPLNVGKSAFIRKVMRECEIRRRFTGGIFWRIPPEINESTGPVAHLDKIRNFTMNPSWPLREGDVFILEGTGEEMARYLDGLQVAMVQLEPNDDPREARLIELSACRTPDLPAFVVEAIGRHPVDSQLLRSKALAETADGGLSVSERTYARFSRTNPDPALHARIAAALVANPVHPFSLKHMLFHLALAGQPQQAVQLARDLDWLQSAVAIHNPDLVNDLRSLGQHELADSLPLDQRPLLAAVAASQDLPMARAAIRHQRANTFVVVAGTGSHILDRSSQAAAENIGGALASKGLGLITGGWPGVDVVVSRAYLAAGGPSLVQVLDADSTGRLSEALHIEPLANEHDRGVKLADACVLIGGMGSTLDVFTSARKLDLPVFPYGPSRGDAARALTMLELPSDDQLRDPNLTPAAFAQLVLHRLTTPPLTLVQQSAAAFNIQPLNPQIAYRTVRDSVEAVIVDAAEVHQALRTPDASTQCAGLALLPSVATPEAARLVASGLYNDAWLNPEVAALALGDILFDPKNWEQLDGIDLTQLLSLIENHPGIDSRSLAILRNLRSFWRQAPAEDPSKLSPFLFSPDRHKRLYALQHSDGNLDKFDAYLETVDHDSEEEIAAGEWFIRGVQSGSFKFGDSPQEVLRRLQEGVVEIERVAGFFRWSEGRELLRQGWRLACDQALDQIEDLVLRQTHEDVLPLLDEALTIATDQQRPRLDFLRVRILWPTQREEALEILRPYEDRDDLPPLSLLSGDPAFGQDLNRHGLVSLAERFNQTYK